MIDAGKMAHGMHGKLARAASGLGAMVNSGESHTENSLFLMVKFIDFFLSFLSGQGLSL